MVRIEFTCSALVWETMQSLIYGLLFVQLLRQVGIPPTVDFHSFINLFLDSHLSSERPPSIATYLSSEKPPSI